MPASGVDLLRCGTNYSVWFHDGECFQHSSDLAAMRKQIERWEGPEGFERWVKWLQEGHRHYEISIREVLRKNFMQFWDMARPTFLKEILDMHPFESIWSRAGRYFYTERLRRVFTFATMYMGMSPFDAPATYSLLQYTEFAEGIWYPKGGFWKVIEALVNIGEKMGVEYRLNTPVTKVITSPDGKKATGVLLENGEELSADMVVVNADLVYSYNNLLPQSNKGIASRSASLQKKDASCSSISFYWSINKKIPQLSTHNIFLAEEYQESFDSIFKEHSLPAEPSFYVNVPSRVDPSAAPENCDSIIVLVPVGHLKLSKGVRPDGLPADEQHWDQIVTRARTAVLRIIQSRTGVSLQEHISHEIVNNPMTWENRFNLDKGAILGLSHNFFNVLWFRPKTKSAELENTYFVGASTHPGTGVPIVLAGAKITAEQMLEDMGMAKPWGQVQTKKKVVSKIMDGRSDSWVRFGTEEFTVLMGLLGVYLVAAYFFFS